MALNQTSFPVSLHKTPPLMFVDPQGMETRQALDPADKSYMTLIHANEQPVQADTAKVCGQHGAMPCAHM